MWVSWWIPTQMSYTASLSLPSIQISSFCDGESMIFFSLCPVKCVNLNSSFVSLIEFNGRLSSVENVKKKELMNARIVVEGKKYFDALNHFFSHGCAFAVIDWFVKRNTNLIYCLHSWQIEECPCRMHLTHIPSRRNIKKLQELRIQFIYDPNQVSCSKHIIDIIDIINVVAYLCSPLFFVDIY